MINERRTNGTAVLIHESRPCDDVAALRDKKRGQRITVCIPARNEESTVGQIVREIARELMGPAGLIDELLVLDDRSTDATATVARRAGAQVIDVADTLRDYEPGSGKGNALWAGMHAATGDIVVFCDADLTTFTFRYVTRLVAPLLADPHIQFVKAYYDRPLDAEGNGGGRTTELLARPMFRLLYPQLATLHQPLSGEFAGRHDILSRVPFVQSYGVEAGLLIDLLALVGTSAITQVDLGVKGHRHRSLRDLSDQATEIAAVILDRSGVTLAQAAAHEAPLERPPLVTATPPLVGKLSSARRRTA
jgi:glucosyl-3-phosphoglycerate synthase